MISSAKRCDPSRIRYYTLMLGEFMKLKGKKVIVTGANRSIGKGIALLFAKEGAELVISYRSDKKGAEETAQFIRQANGIVKAVHADFSTCKV